MEPDDHNDDEQKDRHQFEDRSDDVHKRRLLHSAQNRIVHQPDHHGTADDGREIIAAGKVSREEVVERIHQQNRESDVAENVAQPVCPCHLETGEPPEAESGIRINARCGVRPRIRKNPERVGDKIHSHAGYDPRDNDCNHSRALRHILRQAENTSADHCADDQCRQRNDT